MSSSGGWTKAGPLLQTQSGVGAPNEDHRTKRMRELARYLGERGREGGERVVFCIWNTYSAYVFTKQDVVVWVEFIKTSHFLEVVGSVSVWRGVVVDVARSQTIHLFLVSVSNH